MERNGEFNNRSAERKRKMGGAMKSQEEAVRDVLKGLEGLEMLVQWERSLVRDLHAKAETLLESARRDAGPDDASADRSE